MAKRAPNRNKQKQIHLRLSLRENAYGFLNQSLKHYRQTPRRPQEWPFALLHITQCLELLLKQLLKEINPILIYEDIDRPKRTVSVEQALARLEIIGVAFEEKEKRNIKTAVEYRNLAVHWEVAINKFEWKNVYAQLFEFVHFFHHKHLKSDIHKHVEKRNWPIEARLMSYFNKNFVIYNGVEMHKDTPKDILRAQQQPHLWLGLTAFRRFKYGEEPMWLELDPKYSKARSPCHDCGVLKGQYHADGCDWEQCPKCRKQLLGCGCWIEG